MTLESAIGCGASVHCVWRVGRAREAPTRVSLAAWGKYTGLALRKQRDTKHASHGEGRTHDARRPMRETARS